MESEERYYDAVTHVHDNKRIIEFLLNCDHSAQNVRRKLRACSKSCTRILQSASFEEAQQIAVKSISDITGYDRIKLYPFLPVWSGKIITDGAITIQTSDNGQGIEEKAAETIFTPLKRLHSAGDIEGAGLGLAICKKVVDVHHGTIALYSQYKGGASFISKLPASL